MEQSDVGLMCSFFRSLPETAAFILYVSHHFILIQCKKYIMAINSQLEKIIHTNTTTNHIITTSATYDLTTYSTNIYYFQFVLLNNNSKNMVSFTNVVLVAGLASSIAAAPFAMIAVSVASTYIQKRDDGLTPGEFPFLGGREAREAPAVQDNNPKYQEDNNAKINEFAGKVKTTNRTGSKTYA